MSPRGIRVTRAGPEDCVILADLHGQCIDPSWDDQSIGTIIAASGALGLIARQNGRVSGFALCRAVQDESELLTIGVLPAMRRRGIARTLLDAVMAALTEEAVGALFLEVAEDNVAARGLYDSAGFTAVGRRAAYYQRTNAEAVAALVLRRELTPSSDA